MSEQIPGLYNIPVLVLADVTINTDAAGNGSQTVNWDEGLPPPVLVWANILAPNDTTNQGGSFSFFHDSTNRRTRVFIRNGPASATLKVRVALI